MSLLHIFCTDSKSLDQENNKELSQKTNPTSFLAGICLLDLSKNHEWKSRIFRKPENAHFIREICSKVAEMELSDYNFRNVQAKIMARFMFVAYIHHKIVSEEMFEAITEKISDGEFAQIDFSLRTLIYLIEKLEDDNNGKNLNTFLPSILSSILSAFTNEEIGSHGRE